MACANAGNPQLRGGRGVGHVSLAGVGDCQEDRGGGVSFCRSGILDRVEPPKHEVARTAHDTAYRRSVRCLVSMPVVDMHPAHFAGQSGARNSECASVSLEVEQSKLLGHRDPVCPSARSIANPESMEFEILGSVLLGSASTLRPDRFGVSRPVLSRISIERVPAWLARGLSALPVATISGHRAARK